MGEIMKDKRLWIGMMIITVMCLLFILTNIFYQLRIHPTLRWWLGTLECFLIGITGMSTALYWFKK